MIRDKTDLVRKINDVLRDNTANKIRAADLRDLFFDILDTCLIEDQYYRVETVADFLILLDTLYQSTKVEVNRNLDFNAAFKVRHYTIHLADDTGITNTLTTPGGYSVSVYLAGYEEKETSIVLRNDRKTGNWALLYNGGLASSTSNEIAYLILTGDLVLEKSSAYINHVDPNGAARNILIDRGEQREFRVVSMDGSYPLFILDTDDETPIFELSTEAGTLEAAISYSNGFVRVSVQHGTLVIEEGT